MSAILIRSNGEVLPAEPEDKKSFQLPECYKHLDTDAIQIISMQNGRVMIMDEEGKLKDKPINPSATALARGSIADEDFVVGDVIVCDPKQFR